MYLKFEVQDLPAELFPTVAAIVEDARGVYLEICLDDGGMVAAATESRPEDPDRVDAWPLGLLFLSAVCEALSIKRIVSRTTILPQVLLTCCKLGLKTLNIVQLLA
uniref:Uncharacterized protein n=1 Tax=Micrurus corallinus TaxID=54390 RepID=A0A2D4FEF4_MICCO